MNGRQSSPNGNGNGEHPLSLNGNGKHAHAGTKRILVTGAAGAPALGYVRSLRKSGETFHLIGVDCNKYQLLAAETDERYLVPRASDPSYIPVLRDLIAETGAQLLFAQPDVEITVISRHREELGVKTFLPPHETITLCQDKYKSFDRWQAAGLPVPETRLLHDATDLRSALADFGDTWVRAAEGAAGRGSLHTSDYDQALAWIDSHHGWGTFTAARYLSPRSVTWQSIWHNGELIVAQGRERLQWEFADRAPSGVTGITGAGITVRDEQVDETAQRAILAIDSKPHGIFAVDMTRDSAGVPNPTEINIGRFFTTTLFFTFAGLNMPHIYTKLAFGEKPDIPEPRLNPVEPGLLWVRGMDREPMLAKVWQADAAERALAERTNRLRKKIA
ncbi:MAG: carboxylate--amine ligase [Chloroflexota bacterium]